MAEYPTLDQIAATVRAVIQQEMKAKKSTAPTIFDTWIHESDVLKFCKKSKDTLDRAIKSGKINPKDIRPNPLGKGYLFRQTAIIKD